MIGTIIKSAVDINAVFTVQAQEIVHCKYYREFNVNLAFSCRGIILSL